MFNLFKKAKPVVQVVGHPVRVNNLDSTARIERAKARVSRLSYAIGKHGEANVPKLVAERDVLRKELAKLKAAAEGVE